MTFRANLASSWATGVARDGAAFLCCALVSQKALCIFVAGDFGGGGFAEHGEDKFQIVHVIAQVFALQARELFVLRGRNAEGGLGTFLHNVERSTPAPACSRRFMASQYLGGLALSVKAPTMSITEKYHCSSTQVRRIWLAPKTMILPCESTGTSSLMASALRSVVVVAYFLHCRKFRNIWRAHMGILVGWLNCQRFNGQARRDWRPQECYQAWLRLPARFHQ